jgi:hypothetical protein
MDECAVRAMRKNVKSSSDGGDYGIKKYKRSYGGAYGGCVGICVWREYGVRRSVYVGAFGTNLASFAVKMFSLFTYE